MSMFIRRFLTDPGNEVLLEIESVNILDLEPPASISGIGSGTVLLVGEFENGAFNAPTEVTSATDLSSTFGTLGYIYAGVQANNPCARKRNADGAVTSEFWNGNAFVQMNGKKFRRLICVRVDTSVGSLTFSRQAFITGDSAFSYNLEPAQVLSLDIGNGPVSSTFSATAATITSGAQTIPTLFVGGETLVLGYDEASNFTVTFLAADQSQAQVIARINAYAGFTFAASVTGTTMSLTGILRGTSGQVRVISGSTGVLTALGLAAGTTIGTGNVGNIDSVRFTEIKTIVETAMSSNVKVEQDGQGRLRISKVYAAATDYIAVGPLTTALNLGFTVDEQGSNDGIANYRTTAQTFPTVTSGTLTLGVDEEANFNVAITGGLSQAQVITLINTAAGFTMASSVSGTIMLLRGRANGGQVRVVAAPALILSELGLTLKTVLVPAIVAGVLPAGTQCTNTASTAKFVTMQDLAFPAPSLVNGVYTANAGPLSVKARHALDDGTGTSATAGTITVVTDAPTLSSFSCVNLTTLTVALTETQIDAAYVTAMASTLDLNSVAKEANMIWSARQSNQCRKQLKTNAIEASAIGMQGRMACVRPPLGTTKALAKSNVAEPGVGAYRDQRVIYTYPGANTFVPLIGARGTAGGTGFTADGNVDVGADGFMCSICSQLAPEENPGQETPFTGGINGIETSLNVQGLTMEDYTAFKAAGIAALRISDGVAVFQSGVTSVNPLIYPNLKNIARRRMADFIQDTLATRCKAFGKKLSTDLRRRAITTEIRTFLEGLLSIKNPDTQRIAGYSLDAKSGNTLVSLAAGMFRLRIRVRTLASLDSIVLETTIGESVVVDELPAAA